MTEPGEHTERVDLDKLREHARRGESCGCIQGAVDEIVASRAAVERLTREMERWREREAACCPEDVGFDEHIRTLAGQVAVLREALEHMRWCLSCSEGSWDDCDGGRAANAALASTESVSPGPADRRATPRAGDPIAEAVSDLPPGGAS